MPLTASAWGMGTRCFYFLPSLCTPRTELLLPERLTILKPASTSTSSRLVCRSAGEQSLESQSRVSTVKRNFSSGPVLLPLLYTRSRTLYVGPFPQGTVRDTGSRRFGHEKVHCRCDSIALTDDLRRWRLLHHSMATRLVQTRTGTSFVEETCLHGMALSRRTNPIWMARRSRRRRYAASLPEWVEYMELRQTTNC